MRWRDHKEAAYVGPFVAFMAFLLLIPAFKVDHDSLPWWKSAPEHWIYPLQTAVVLGLLCWWWRNYDFKPANFQALAFGALIGVVGIALWIAPSILRDRWNVPSWGWPPWLTDSLGLTSRAGPGFNPDIFAENPAAYWSTVVMRFVRMTIAVPLLEELFWRGFLWRYLADPNRPFQQIPFGVWNPRAIGITILLFMGVHHQTDWLGALIYGVLISWVAFRTKSLAACVVCHAVSNFVLGIYVMQTKQWGFW